MVSNFTRTYKRRATTRKSGYHTCEETTGGECIIKYSQRYIMEYDTTWFSKKKEKLELVELFENGISIIAFGGYVYSENNAQLDLYLEYYYENKNYEEKKSITLEAKRWNCIGLHKEQIIDLDNFITNVKISLNFKSKKDNAFDMIGFNLNVISKDEFLDTTFFKNFYQKTEVTIPALYYFDGDFLTNEYIVVPQNIVKNFSKGRLVVLKSCNRCGRYLPIDIEDELKTVSFSSHCKKNAPCTHSTFRAYEIENIDEIDQEDLNRLNIKEGKLISYYGHQLECKACKKFFVNAPLNPQRNPQQFKEDGLRRRALEVLISHLLKKHLFHFEFEATNKKEFSKYIWEKFDKRCFKCGPTSDPIDLKDMALDHTMPLAYLYRLDQSATCLCHSHNSQKSDHFPVDFYSEEELQRLSSITGLSIEILHKREINQEVLKLLIKEIIWFFDIFLMDPNYQKIREGIRTADKIFDSLRRVINNHVDLVEEYYKLTKTYPKSITIVKENTIK